MTAVPDPKIYREIAVLLDQALSFGIRVGAAPDASEMILAIPLRLPSDIAHWFEHELSIRQHEVVHYILKENGMTGATS
jgi:hypothetical protein